MSKLISQLFDDPQVARLLQPCDDEIAGLDMVIEDLRGPGGKGFRIPDVTFQLSCALISHRRPEYIREGLTLMEGLVFQHWQQERQRAKATKGCVATAPPVSDDDDDARHEGTHASPLPIYYYYLSIAWTKLEDFAKARSSIERMLHIEPNNMQGRALQSYIEKQQTKEGVIGLAGLAAAGIAAAAVFAGVFSKRR